MFRKLINSRCFKPSLVLMAMAMLFMSFTAPSGTVVLKAGTTVPLSLETTIDGNNVRTGQTVQFRVVQDIKVDGKTIIAAGSLAQGLPGNSFVTVRMYMTFFNVRALIPNCFCASVRYWIIISSNIIQIK